ncbi:MAG: TonB family protein [Desulfuromonadales bacterium]
MELKSRPDVLLLAFITVSLLLHLLLFFLLPHRDLFPVAVSPEPVIVEMRPPQPLRQGPRELDLPIRPELEKPREKPAKRLGPADQVVRKETAPKGSAAEDMRPDAPVPPTPARRPAQTAVPKTVLKPRTPAPAPVPERPAENAPSPRSEVAETAPSPAPPTTQVPDLNSLLKLPQTTVARLEKEWRQKYRGDAAQGDTVWLDTEKDILISFFRRFRSNIYSVWNYPTRAKERGEEGTCLLKVTVNRDGTLQKVRVMESSGYQILDDEAVEAVQKGSPFGPLHSAYKGETLNIFVFFQYNLSRVNFRRPGNIY